MTPAGRAPLWRALSRALSWPLLVLIRIYKRLISPLLPPACRFYPTCSSYGLEAIELHGPFKGSWLTVRRVCRCHPFHPGGLDPVPGSEMERQLRASAEEGAAGVSQTPPR